HALEVGGRLWLRSTHGRSITGPAPGRISGGSSGKSRRGRGQKGSCPHALLAREDPRAPRGPMSRAPALCLLLLLPLVAGCPSREPDSTRGPTLVTAELPAAQVGVPYLATLEATGGGAPRTFSVEALPDGL